MPKSAFVAVLGALVLVAVGAPGAGAQDMDPQMQMCGACHGQNGTPQDQNTPIIWGQQSSYLFKQLHDYKSHDRDNPVMSPVVADITLENLRKIAAAFAAKTWPERHAAAGAAAASEPDGIAVCKACHQPHFEGSMAGPRLAGQSYDYLIGAMNSFANGGRTNNLDMPTLMHQLTEAQRDAIAHYLAEL